MHRPSRRGAVAIALVATLGPGTALATTASAADQPSQPRQVLGLNLLPALPIPAELAPVLATVTGLAPAQVTQLVASLTPAELGQVLAGANTEQLLALVVGLTPEQVQAALATLTPAQQQQTAGNVAAAQAAAGQKPTAKAPAPAASLFTGYRASIGSAKVSKNRTSTSFVVKCPASAPKGCFVRVTAKVAGKKAGTKDFLVARNGSQNGSIKLSSSAAKRLKSKGGSVQLTGQTVTSASTVNSSSKTVKVKAPAKRKTKK